jgi:hypothetical protein
LGFVCQNKYSFKIAINKKWPKNQSYLEEDQITNICLLQGDKHNSATSESWLKMQGYWNNDNDEMSKAMVESCKGMDNELAPNIKGSPRYYHR